MRKNRGKPDNLWFCFQVLYINDKMWICVCVCVILLYSRGHLLERYCVLQVHAVVNWVLYKNKTDIIYIITSLLREKDNID